MIIKSLISLYLLITPLIIHAQYYGFPYYYVHSDGWHLEGDPILIDKDSIINRDCLDYQYSGYYDCIYDIDLIWLYNDSSKTYLYHKEKGKAILGKKYGKWFVENGYYKDSVRIKGNNWVEHYINNYNIPYAEHVSDTIYYDFDKKMATCIMTHFGSKNFPETKVRLVYYPSNNLDTTYVKCYSLDSLEIFKTTTEYVEEEIKLMVDGYYNRQIYVR